MVYITGDTHGDFARIASFCKKMQITPEDIMIILGDAALNYFADERDVQRKKYVSKLPVTFSTFTEITRRVRIISLPIKPVHSKAARFFMKRNTLPFSLVSMVRPMILTACIVW